MKLTALTNPYAHHFFGASNFISWQWRNITNLSSKTTYPTKSLPKKILVRSEKQDEGSWAYSSEWWGTNSDHLTHSVFRAVSSHGNGVVSVLAYPSSKPSPIHWPKREDWLQRGCAETCSDLDLRVLGYQWRVLRFNDITRQSTAKVMLLSDVSDPSSVYYMQQPHCLAKTYIKSMISSGLTTLSYCNYELLKAVNGKQKMRVLCVGHGGGSLPLFLASEIQGAVIDTIEIDPVVVSASVHAMGFPAFSVASPSINHSPSRANAVEEVLWRGIHDRLLLHESDAEDFILNTSNIYDIVFVDTYDGEDIFPRKLCDPQYPFLQALACRLHPHHGTVVVNLHSSAVRVSPEGKIVSEVCQAYKNKLVGEDVANGDPISGTGFVVSVPWVRNTTLVVGRCLPDGALDQNSASKLLISESSEVDRALSLPFSCSEYLKGGLVVLD